jgi:hypothetical protein
MYDGGRGWGCRRCLRLRYLSQRLAPADRLQRRADQILERAGIHDDGDILVKPKRMRWRTYERLVGRYNAAASAADYGFAMRAARLLDRLGVPLGH